MHPAGVAEVERAKADGRWEAAYAGPASIEVPDDLAAALEAEPRAQEHVRPADAPEPLRDPVPDHDREAPRDAGEADRRVRRDARPRRDAVPPEALARPCVRSHGMMRPALPDATVRDRGRRGHSRTRRGVERRHHGRDPPRDGDVRARRRHVADERLDLGRREGPRHDRERRAVGDRARGARVGGVHPDRQQGRAT